MENKNKYKKVEEHINRVNKKLLLFILSLFIIIINISFISASADFAVNSFSCTPSEAAINNVFSCTAQIKNNGDASGTVSTATLYPDANDWLEDSSYAKSSGVSVSPGQTTEVTFTGLRAVKSGSNGFSRITLDSVTDTYVSDNNVKVNVIDVAVIVSNTQSSRAMGQTFDSSAQVTAGGNIDVTLTFTVVSGGCTIGNQASQKTISGMQNGNQQSRSWTSVTMGSGSSARNCVFTITAAATGANGIASKTDSSPNTITCTNCPSDSTTTTDNSAGGGGGGGAIKVYTLGVLTESREVEMGSSERANFNISGGEHKLTLKNQSATTALIEIESKKQTFTMTVGDKIDVDLNENGTADISVKLKSINIITNKVKLIITPLVSSEGIAPSTGSAAEAETAKKEGEGAVGGGIFNALPSGMNWIYWVIGFFVIIALISFVYHYFVRKKRRELGIR